MIQIMELVVSTTAMNFCFDIWVTFLVFILISAHSPLFKFLVIFRLSHINNSIITPFPLTPLHSTIFLTYLTLVAPPKPLSL